MMRGTKTIVCNSLEASAILCLDGVSVRTIVALTPYICATCDKTHLNIDLGAPNTAMSVTFTPEQAEALAEKLINPFLDPTEKSNAH
jgi:type II secretory pathway component PulK